MHSQIPSLGTKRGTAYGNGLAARRRRLCQGVFGSCWMLLIVPCAGHLSVRAWYPRTPASAYARGSQDVPGNALAASTAATTNTPASTQDATRRTAAKRPIYRAGGTSDESFNETSKRG